jgi:small-conductance mechanosensitive channel
MVSASGLTVDEQQEAILRVERHYAVQKAAEAAAQCEQLKAAARVTLLDEEVVAAKVALAGLQKELLGVLAKDDPVTIKTVRARLAARQAASDAAEGDKALILKNVEEAERERDAWKKRVATLELARRLDMQVMLAGASDIEDREKRVDNAVKDMDYQQGHIAIFQARRANAVMKLIELNKLLAVLGESLNEAATAELRRALAEHVGQLRRLAGQHQEWFLLNKRLEDRGRRNLAFARTDYLISRRYADALARKAEAHRLANAQASAVAADGQLAALRGSLTALQQRVAAELATAVKRGDAALKALGEARTTQAQEQGHKDYAAAQAMKERWTVEGECWKEFIALQKAGAAFAREVADRARTFAEDRNIFEINQDERQLRDSLVTSEQYVHSLALMVQKADSLIESDRRVLGLGQEDVAALAQPFAELFGAYDAGNPPAAELITGQFQELVSRLTSGQAGEGTGFDRRREAGTTLVLRLAEREMVRARKAISERWLDQSRAAIGNLERLAGTRLWQQHDPRLNGITFLNIGTMFGAAVSDALFVRDCQRLHLCDAEDVPDGRTMLRGFILMLCLGFAGWGIGRWLRNRSGLLWLIGRLAGTLPPLLGLGVWLLRVGGNNLAFQGLGWLALGLAAGLAVRYALLTLVAGHRPPPGATFGGGVFAAVQAVVGWTLLLFPLYRLAAGGSNAGEIQAVVGRVWLLGVCMAMFRLLLHPSLMGRILSRRSEHRGLRWLGSSVAIACTTAATLAALPYLAGLDNLGGTVLHTVEVSFALLGGALIGTTAAGWAFRRHVAQAGVKTAWVRTLQTGVILVAGAGVAWMWWQLLNRVVLAPNAPPLVQDAVRTSEQVLRTALGLWRRELTPGMTVSSLMRGLLVFVLSFWLSRVVKRQFLEKALARTPMDETTRLTFSTILGYLVILLGFLVGLNVAGSSLQNLALLAGAITVGLGFGLQNVINNFVSSLLIHFGRTIRVGDFIEVGGTRGIVREIGLRNTSIITDDGITVLVPNGSFVSANIVNWTNPSRRVRLHVPLTAARLADLTAVTELAIAIARNHPLIMKEPGPLVEVRAVTAAQVSLELLAWTEKPERLASIVGELSLALDQPLRDKGFLV